MHALVKDFEAALDAIKEIVDGEEVIYFRDPRLHALDKALDLALNALLDARFPGRRRDNGTCALALSLSHYVEIRTTDGMDSVTLRIADHRNTTRQHLQPAGNIVCGDTSSMIEAELEAVAEALAELEAE